MHLHSNDLTAAKAMFSVWQRMPYQRRRQLWSVLALMGVGGLAEVVSIGSVVPFLAIVIDPERVANLSVTRWFMDTSGMKRDDLLSLAIGSLIAAAVIASGMRLWLAWATQKLVMDIGHDLGVEIYSRMLRQPYSLYINRNTSELISGINKIQNVIFSVLLPAMQGVVAITVASFIIAMLVAIDPTVALIAAGALGLTYVVVSLAFRSTIRRAAIILAASQDSRIRLIQEGLGGIRDILIDQSQAVFERQFRKLDQAYRRAETINIFIAAAPRFIIEGVGIVLIALLVLAASTQPGGVLAAIPVIGALALGAQRLLPLMQQIYSSWTTFKGASVLLVDVERLLRAPVSRNLERAKGNGALSFQHNLTLRNVSFRYDGQAETTLCGINLTIRKGHRVGFIGRTGSGKSTLIDLVMGLLQPQEGELAVDGVTLDERNWAQWQGCIAHVPQSIFLTDSSIAENIAFGEDPDAVNMERVIAAAQLAQIDEFVSSLPLGYKTRTGERGIQLSGGQRQRVGIARALYKGAEVLVLDEATSALDHATEAALMAELSSVDRKLTVLMIAHRLSTLACCDQIVQLEAGRVVAIGSYDEVVGVFQEQSAN